MQAQKIFDLAKMFEMPIILVYNQIQEHRLNLTSIVSKNFFNFVLIFDIKCLVLERMHKITAQVSSEYID